MRFPIDLYDLDFPDEGREPPPRRLGRCLNCGDVLFDDLVLEDGEPHCVCFLDVEEAA